MYPKNRYHFILPVLLLSAGMSHAALIIYEPFNDTNSTVQSNTPGTGLTGTYTSTGSTSPGFAVSGTSLSYGSQPTSGGAASFVGTTASAGSGNAANAVGLVTSGSGSLAGNGLLTDGATLWFSVMQRTTNNAPDDRFAFSLGSDPLTSNTSYGVAAAQGVGFQMSSAGLLSARFSTASGTHVNGATINRFSLATTILIVGKITWGATDTVELYLPDTSGVLGSVVSTTSSAVDQTAFDNLSFFTRIENRATADGTNTNVGLDEIRFGSTLGDVLIPEPSCALLGGLGLLALLRRRR